MAACVQMDARVCGCMCACMFLKGKTCTNLVDKSVWNGNDHIFIFTYTSSMLRNQSIVQVKRIKKISKRILMWFFIPIDVINGVLTLTDCFVYILVVGVIIIFIIVMMIKSLAQIKKNTTMNNIWMLNLPQRSNKVSHSGWLNPHDWLN